MNQINNKLTPVEAPKTLAILQITRFGDLIQTLQAAEGFKDAYPNYRLILIARKAFAKPLEKILLKTFDQIYELDTKRISQDAANGTTQALSDITQFVTNLNQQESIDVLINLSFSKSSSYLSSLIKSTHKVGPFYNFQNQIVVQDKWSQFVYSNVMRGALNPFNIVDIFRCIIGLKKTESIPIPETKKSNKIIVHPFASQERKKWKTDKWIEVIYKLLKDNKDLTINIVGSNSESHLAEAIINHPLMTPFRGRLQTLAGKTTISETIEILKESKLFIGHDSMVGHLAALAKVPTITVSLGSVRPQETTPYLAGAICISPKTKCFPCFPQDKCSFYQCHLDVPYQVVTACAQGVLKSGKISQTELKNNTSAFHLSSVSVQIAEIDQNHFMQLRELGTAESDSRDIFRTFYRIIWQFLLNGIDENAAFPHLNLNTHKSLLTTLGGIQYLFDLCEFGKKYSRYILEEIGSATPSIAKIKEFSKKIDEIDELQRLVQQSAPMLAPIIDYYALAKSNLSGENIVQLTESSYLTYHECGTICSVLYDLIENTIAEHKTGRELNKEFNK